MQTLPVNVVVNKAISVFQPDTKTLYDINLRETKESFDYPLKIMRSILEQRV